jgi:hypothetical protein
MKKLIVILFIISLGLSEWQEREEFTLPKGIQISDIKVGPDGKVWILTKSSLSYVDFAKKSINLVYEIEDGKLLALEGNEFLIINNNNSLTTLNSEGNIRVLSSDVGNPVQIEVLKINKRSITIVGGLNQINFIENNRIISTLVTEFVKFSLPARFGEKEEIALYTMTNNQIYVWTGENLNNPGGFKNRLLYSASENIIDFTTGFDGKNYILFKDSILILNPDGTREDKILINDATPGSRIYVYPLENSVLLFNKGEKTLKILSRLNQPKNDLIILNKNRPNPVDNYTEFEFTLNEPMYINFTIYNLIGKPVKVLASGFYNKGTYTIPWHADDEKGMLVPNGVYFYRLEAKKGVLIKQLIVLR